jgi:hypothetical protein
MIRQGRQGGPSEGAPRHGTARHGTADQLRMLWKPTFQRHPHGLHWPDSLIGSGPDRVDRPETALYGWVYIARRSDSLVKIGCTLTPDLRKRQLETGGGLPFIEFHSWRVYAPGAAERHLHAWYGTCRVLGEWFALDAETVSGICAYMATAVSPE